MDIKKKIKKLPDSPGIYFMKDKKGSILYIGKASSIRKRVGAYFVPSRAFSRRAEAMASQVADVDYIVTGSEAEALIYEAQLVKEHRPRYNVVLKDDKAYPLLKLTINQRYPRLFITRRRKDDGARYFGPYVGAKLLRQALAIMRRIFPLRTCSKFPKNVCLMYHLGQCMGPCEGKVSSLDYAEIVKQLQLFLEGKRKELVKKLSEQMDRMAKKKRFEEAARLRDRIKALTQGLVAPKLNRDRHQLNLNGVCPYLNELVELKKVLKLPSLPLTIDAFDISNIFGNWAVGSMVQFCEGIPNKANYRRFKIRSIAGIDDYMMTKEVVHRRYKRCLEEKVSLPHLVIIDGGKGHLSVAYKELEALSLGYMPVAAIAKEYEKVYLPGKKNPVILSSTSTALRLIQRIRDEAHRFAISYHRGLRRKVVRLSELDAIAGIGPKRKQELVRHFGSIEAIRKASIDELCNAGSINRKLARVVAAKLKST